MSGLYNSELDLKVRLRERFLQDISSTKVLDVFAGPGEMFKAIYKKALVYIGIEKNKQIPSSGREIIYGESTEILKTLNLKDFNVFDLDAFSNPWKEFFYILERGPDSFCVFLTESSGRVVSSDISDYVTPKNQFSKKLDRIGSIKFAVNQSVSESGRRIVDSVFYMKKRQPRTIYAGIRVEKGPSSGPL